MIVFPEAKINIGLNVISKRIDGYHNISSVMFPIGLCDILEVVISDKCKSGINSFTNTGLKIDSEVKNNLIIKAYNILANDYFLPSIDIHIHKVIPFGAGLGGGSSNASSMLTLLNNLFNMSIPRTKLKMYAARLGSDCPFFIDNIASLATGKGDILEPIIIDLKGFYLLLVFPGINISTVEAYSNVTVNEPEESLVDLISEPVFKWKNIISNSFETGVFAKFPEILQIKNLMYDAGAIYASMSGSGSALYGLFSSKPMIPKEFSQYFVFEEEL